MAGTILERARKILQSQCAQCEYDEAEGGFIDHCDGCCRRIVTELYGPLILGEIESQD